MAKDEEGEFRLRPRKPPARNERAAWASAYKILMHHARMSRQAQAPVGRQGSGPKRVGPYSQRCAVRVMYAKKQRCRAVASTWALRRAGKRHA